MSTARIDELRMIDPVLSTVAQGYTNAAMVSTKLFPIVEVSKLKGKVPEFGRESFLIRDTVRAIRAASNRIAPADVNMIEFQTQERDIETAIDYLEEEESPDFLRYEQRLTRDLMDILLLEREKLAADLAQDTGNYGSGLTKTLDDSNCFDDYSLAIDPVAIIKQGMIAVREKIAKYPNTMVMGDSVYNALTSHPKIIERVKYAGISKVDVGVFRELFGIKDIHIGRAVQTEDGATFSDIWQDNIIMAYTDKNERGKRSEFNPSFGYTFRRKDMPEVDSYFENGGKLKVVRATENYTIKITAQDAAYLITGAVLYG